MKDTLRLLLTWTCNLTCSYCCNEIPEVRESIKPMSMKEFQNLDYSKYDNICISGGEPFLNIGKLYYTLFKIPYNKDIYIYSNGIMITQKHLDIIKQMHPNVKGINIGLHYTNSFDKLINKFKHEPLIRFHVEDIYKELITRRYKDINFKFWHRNDCEMNNEEIRILKNE
jgi:molybdenum cofactor biosynthesis enzyme MoaA